MIKLDVIQIVDF